ncbi:aminotransferase class I/II-fold pyridoxal phosphate-dependent enzyme [Streptomyces sp. NPDC046994]|uniref:MalY/PatB family protein n=1 Tax=Streptomyces sp. NPDC046994 TaxID=3155735 RepID=UPI003454EFE5
MTFGAARRPFDLCDPDTLLQRDGEKWAAAGEGMLASWVADMDFPVPPVIREAVLRRLDGDLGYPAWFDESDGGPLGEVFAERMRRRFGCTLEAGYVRLFTDINQALLAVLEVATERGDGVLLHTPACPPFVSVIEHMGREAVTIPVDEGPHGWEFDSARMERAIARTGRRCRVLFLVNPHNPTGRVLRRDELQALATIALRHDLLVVSDEVHADLVYSPHRHVPFASLGDEIAARTVTLTSGSKAFNLAGVRCAVAHIGPRSVRKALDDRRGLLFGRVSILAVEALKAAWTAGDPWLDTVRAVLDCNRRRLTERLPDGIRTWRPEGTFLAWLDCTRLDLGTDPMNFFRDEARVLLFSGLAFGAPGEGFVRLNFATYPNVLEETLNRMHVALNKR